MLNIEVYFSEKGNHGYNNSFPDMHPFFIAMGPSFKKGYAIDTFDNVDIYPLMCVILGIKPAPNNGSLKNVQSLLKVKPKSTGIFNYDSTFLICKSQMINLDVRKALYLCVMFPW